MSRIILDDVWADDLPPPPWLLPHIMMSGQMIILAGDAGVGKSLLALVWAHSLAAGIKILGNNVKPVKVLYINEENSYYDMREYLRWARFGMNGIDEELLKANLRVEQFSLTLSDIRWFDNLRMLCDDWKPSLIVIDTATPSCQIQDEDKNGEASIAIGHLRRAIRASAKGCGMLVLKHAKIIRKGEDRTIRGAKAWKGACDGLIFHTRTAGRARDDGLHCTYLWPDKSRAFGLKKRLKISPCWVNQGTKRQGILLATHAEPE